MLWHTKKKFLDANPKNFQNKLKFHFSHICFNGIVNVPRNIIQVSTTHHFIVCNIFSIKNTEMNY